MKKFIVFLGICLICVNCGQKFNDAIATAVIQEVFKLSEDDVIEIIGTSMESKDTALVKFKVNEVQISSKMRRYDKGWQIDLIRDELGKWIPAETIINFIAQQGKKTISLLP